MSDPRPKQDWRDGMVAAGALMVLLCGLCSGWTANLHDPYISSSTLFVGGPPIMAGVVLIAIGLTRRRGPASPPFSWRMIVPIVDGGLRMAIGAVLMLFGTLGALIALTFAVSAGLKASPSEILRATLSLAGAVAVSAALCVPALLGGWALYQNGRENMR